MSVVKKMLLQGVRSFNPNDNKGQTIEFQCPLTLILGVNGSGKTTIIEALKYGITNQFPPNCLKGSSFVNDPKLTNGYDATALVKLDVEDARGNAVSTTRRVKVTVKDKLGNLQMKQLDSSIKIQSPKGDVKEINSKCTDIKAEMCRVMGVSEAILNHVIFCHQEDSCWPLDEGKKVKEKFDSIFNTTMYIKCLDQLAKQDKELGLKAKIEQEQLKYVVENRKIAKKKKKDLAQKDVELQAVSDLISKHEGELGDMEKKLKDLVQLEQKYTEIANEVASVQGKKEAVDKQVVELKSKIKDPFEGSISSLEVYIGQFEKEHEAISSNLIELQKQLRLKEGDLKKLHDQQKGFLLEQGKFQQEEGAHQKRLTSISTAVQDIAETLKKMMNESQDSSFTDSMHSCIDVCEANLQTASPEKITRALTAAIRAKEAEVSKIKASYEAEEETLQKSINELRSKKVSLETEINMKKDEISKNKATIIELKTRLQTIEGSNETLALLGDDEAKFIEQIETIETSGLLERLEKETQALSQEIKTFDSKISTLAVNVDILHSDKSKLDQIAIFNRQKMQKDNESKDIMRRIEDDLKTLLGDIPEMNLSKAVEKKRESLAKERNQKAAEQKKNERELTIYETELKRVCSDLESKESKINVWNRQIEELLEDGAFEDAYEQVSQNLEKSQKESYYAEAARYLYKKYIQKLNKKDCCPLCKRDIETKERVRQLINEIEKEVEKMQQNEPLEKESIEKLKTRQQELIDVKPVWDERQKLETQEIPALKEKKSSLEEKIINMKETIEDLSGIVAVLDTDYSTAVKCSKDVGLYEQAWKEVKKHEEQITKIEASRDIRAKNLLTSTSLTDAKAQLEECTSSLNARRTDKDKKSEMLNTKKKELTELQTEKNKVREQILQITSELQNREALELQKKELEKMNVQLQDEVSSLVQDLPKAKSDIERSEKEKHECSKKKDDRVHGLRNEKENLEKYKTKFSDWSKQIQDFEQKKSRFIEIEKRFSVCKSKVDETETFKTEVMRKIESAKSDISNHELKRRSLDDNLLLKRKMEEIKCLEVLLAEKQKLFQSTSNRGVTIERKEISSKHHTLSAKMNELRGTRKGIQSAIRDLTKELSEKPLVNAESEFVKKFVKKTVYEKAQRDVRRYKTALDNAIMKFHSKRMEMINQILWDYWRRIYKGNDIDAIQIRTEAAGTKPMPGTGHKVKVETGTRARKNYNYRVVMVRRGIELDMRGRCSAGQRVLASIIIRIALAESFSARCGIISLDEPTTNLDQRNINSLADALSTLAEKMSARGNFQLIVITHDQEFTERLSVVDSVEKYWKVTRDPMGFSKITAVYKRG